MDPNLDEPTEPAGRELLPASGGPGIIPGLHENAQQDLTHIAERLFSSLQHDARLDSGAPGIRESAPRDLAIPSNTVSSPSAHRPLARLDDLLARLRQDDTESPAVTDAPPPEPLDGEGEDAALDSTAPYRPLPHDLAEVERLLQDLENQPRDVPPRKAPHPPVYWTLALISIAALIIIYLYIYILQ